jgi:GNAT superfamily N-acetyltransferase
MTTDPLERVSPGIERSPTIDLTLRPGDLGQVVALHGHSYAAIAGFGIEFEALVAADLAAFARRGDALGRIWLARNPSGDVIGSVAVDRSNPSGSAHLRWFVVDHRRRGAGLGHRLLAAAIEHCDGAGVTETELWTFQGLDAARALYERHGFVLAEEQQGDRWGSTVVEQRFVRVGR